jgi:hypothetical protein
MTERVMWSDELTEITVRPARGLKPASRSVRPGQSFDRSERRRLADAAEFCGGV